MNEDSRLARIGSDVGNVVFLWVVLAGLCEAGVFVWVFVQADLRLLAVAVILGVLSSVVLLFRLRQETIMGAIFATLSLEAAGVVGAMYWVAIALGEPA